MRPIGFGEGLGHSIGKVALAGGCGAADDESLSLLLELRRDSVLALRQRG
jgi:hypothetical protein